MGSISHALTGDEIITRARVFLRDTSQDTTRQKFSSATLVNFLDDGQKEANSLAWLLRSSFTFELRANTTEYFLPDRFIASKRVYYKNRSIPQTSFGAEDSQSRGWRSASCGTPNKYYIHFGTTPVMGFLPCPTNTSTGTIEVFQIEQPVTVVSSTQTPWNGWQMLSPYHSSLAYYIAYRGFQALGQPALGERFFQEWQLFIDNARTGLLKMPDFNPGFRSRRTDQP